MLDEVEVLTRKTVLAPATTTQMPSGEMANTVPGWLLSFDTALVEVFNVIRPALLPKKALVPPGFTSKELGCAGNVMPAPEVFVVVSIGASVVVPVPVANTILAEVPLTVALATLLYTDERPKLQVLTKQLAVMLVAPGWPAVAIPVELTAATTGCELAQVRVTETGKPALSSTSAVSCWVAAAAKLKDVSVALATCMRMVCTGQVMNVVGTLLTPETEA